MNFLDVIELYVALFGRAPEGEGVHNWYRAAVEGRWSEDELAQKMIEAAQVVVASDAAYGAIYPQYIALDSKDPQSVREFIASIYEILFGKGYSEDPQGIDGWVGYVESGHSLGEVAVAIIDVAHAIARGDIAADAQTVEFAKAFESRVDVARYVAEKIERFSGDFELFRSFVDGVDGSEKSVVAAVERVGTSVQKEPMRYDDLSLEVRSLLIDGGIKANKTTITYSFDATMPSEYAQDVAYSTGWQPVDEATRVWAREAFGQIAAITNLQFQEVSKDGDIRFSFVDIVNSGELGFAVQLVKNGEELVFDGIGGDVFLAKDYAAKLYGLDVVLHEIGHALGLKHPFEGSPQMPKAQDNTLYTIMSYTHKEDFLPKITITPVSNGYSYLLEAAPLGRKSLGLYDIEALRFLYGKKETHLGNDLYDVSGVYTDFAYVDIVDDGGIDTIEFHSEQMSSIDLGYGSISGFGKSLPYGYIEELVRQEMKSEGNAVSEFSTLYDAIVGYIENDPLLMQYYYQGNGNVTVEGEIEDVVSGEGDDFIYDNDLDNIIVTGAGNDVIVLRSGDDVVDGGAGFDKVVIEDSSEPAVIGGLYGEYLVFEDRVVLLKNVEEWEVV